MNQPTPQLGIVVNRKAGAAVGRSPRRLIAMLRAALQPVRPVAVEKIVSGSRLDAALAELADDSRIGVIVAAGGDGTVALAARHALRTGKRLLPLPLGTFNLFARSLGWGGDARAALAMLEAGEHGAVDVGVVNGQTFIHHVTCGLHPRYVRVREVIPFGSRIGKVMAGARALARTVRTTPSRRIRVRSGGETLERHALGLAVTVNRLAEGIGRPPVPDHPDGGQLAIYVASASSTLERLDLIATAIRGRWEHSNRIAALTATDATIAVGRRRIPASVDGEFVHLRSPLRLSIRPGALNVVRPRRVSGA